MLRSALVIPDCHVPFEDLKAYALMLMVARNIENLCEIVILGDFLDVYGLSFYEKDPTFGDLSQLYDREIDCVNHRLDEIQKFNCPVTYLEGNHEFRVKKYIKKFAPALRNRYCLTKELGLEKRKINWIPFTKEQAHNILGCGLYAKHCPPVGGGIQNVAKQSGDSVIFGHTHQLNEGTFITKLNGRKVRAINSGWLGDKTQQAFDYVQNIADWSLGFSIVTSYKTGFHCQVIQIEKDYSCMFGNRRFSK